VTHEAADAAAVPVAEGVPSPRDAAMAPFMGKSANELAAERTAYAVKRTIMGADRTLMAWVRTALSLYSFGFTIYKLLQDFAQGVLAAHHIKSGEPRTVGLVLTGAGAVTMVMGCIDYWFTVRGLGHVRRAQAFRPVFVMSLVMSAMGVFLFIGIISKIL
jgi:putative membrane protein